MRIGLQIPDLTWPGGPSTMGADLARIVRTADEGGFSSIAVMDHLFQIGNVGPADNDMLEAYATLGFIAANTSRAQLYTLVTAATYRSPGLLAKTVTTLDVLSGGRAALGIGAGWNAEEAGGLGLSFPPTAERFERLEETLRICLQMWAGDDSAFTGQHYTLERPLNVPQSLSRPHPPIMIGGMGEKKTLRLVAKYAQACNLFVTPELSRKLEVLREHCEREGRDYDEIEKTAYFPFDLGAGSENVGAILDDLGAHAELGIQSVIGQVKNVSQITPLETIATEIIPIAAKL